MQQEDWTAVSCASANSPRWRWALRESIDAARWGIEYARTCYGTSRRSSLRERGRRSAIHQIADERDSHCFKSDKPGASQITEPYMKKTYQKVLEGNLSRLTPSKIRPGVRFFRCILVSRAIRHPLETVEPKQKKRSREHFRRHEAWCR